MFQLQPTSGPASPDALPTPDAERVNIGELLRTAREGRARSLESCADALRIRLADLRALEANAFDTLPGGGITVSWLRRYARLLGLSPDLLVATYRAQYQGEARSFRSDLTTVIRRKSRRGRRRSLLAFGFALVIVLMILVIGVAALPMRLLSGLLQPDRTTAATVPQGETVLPAAPPPAPLPAVLPPAEAVLPPPRAAVGTPGTSLMLPSATTVAMGGLRLLALAPVQLDLRDGEGYTVFFGRLYQGEIYAVPPSRGVLQLRADRPEALRVLGDAAPAL